VSVKKPHPGVHPLTLSSAGRLGVLKCQVAFTMMFSRVWDGALIFDSAK
jgi:hypothetical protein